MCWERVGLGKGPPTPARALLNFRVNILTRKTATAQVVEMSVTVNKQPYSGPRSPAGHPDNHAPPTYEMTPGFNPLTVFNY